MARDGAAVTPRRIDDDTLRRATSAFSIAGACLGAVRYGSGHINDTFAAVFEHAGARTRYLVQRINGAVFRRPVEVMENIANVTAHLRARAIALGVPDPERRVLTLVAARDGRAYHVDDEGQVWRCYIFIDGAHGHDIVANPSQAFESARAFGRLQAMLADYRGPGLHETIPGFHDTRSRLAALERAVEVDVANRAAGARAEIELAASRRPLAGTLLELRDHGLIPERVTHNDCKLNNVLLDDESGEGICVVDLDTVMPGLSLYDFGDLVRSATNPVAEDHPDSSAVRMLPEAFAALARGYLAGAGGTLLPIEREHLVTAGMVLTYECGIRFLTDHLQGDVYFPAHRADHNLARARVQFALLRSLEAHEDELSAVVAALD